MRAKKDRVRLRVCWRTAASEHGRSYAITVYLTTNVSATQGLPRKRVALVYLVCLEYLAEPDQPDEPVCSLLQEFATVGGGEILVGAKGDDSSRIDVVVGDVVVPLDVVEVYGVGDAVSLIEVFEIAE